MDFLIHWPPGPVVATVQCQGLMGMLGVLSNGGFVVEGFCLHSAGPQLVCGYERL